MLRISLIMVCFLLAEISLAEPATTLSATVEILSAEFGLFEASDSGEVVFEPARIVPHRVGQRYGWVIEVRTSNRSLSVREEYLLPMLPKEQKNLDSLSETLNMLVQRRNQVSQRQLVPLDGRIYGEWAIGSGEPAGHRHLQVTVENQVAASFEFDVK